MFCFGFHKVLRGGSTILVYLKITMECFVLLSIMSNPQQPRGINEEDMERAIEAYSGTGDFLKKILGYLLIYLQFYNLVSHLVCMQLYFYIILLQYYIK